MRDKEKAKIYQEKYMREVWYPKNQVKERNRMKQRRRAMRNELAALKDKPCLDCGHKYPHYVMDYDHVRGKKAFDIARFATRGNRAKLQEELKKCELVCSNCHRIRTWNRKEQAEKAKIS